MNIIDKMVNFFDPVKGAKREYARRVQRVIKNSGYSHGGASTTKRSLQAFEAESFSPVSDIDHNLKTLRERSRVLEMTSPLAAAAINTTTTKTVGSGLYAKPSIDYEYLGISKEEAEEWEHTVEREFLLWSESKHCDASSIHNFYEMQELIFRGMISNGDGIALVKHRDTTPFMPYSLRLQVIESDRVSTPIGVGDTVETINYTLVEGRNTKTGNRVVSGIEIDDDGKKVAYFVCNQYPDEYMRIYQKPREWVRVAAYGKKTGNPNILHLYNATRAGAYRGVPLLAIAIEPLKQLTRYSEAELMAAVVASMFTVFVTTNDSSATNPLSGINNPFAASAGNSEERVRSDVSEMTMGSGAITMLENGERIEIANPSRPNTSYDPFVMSLYKQIGASIEIPYEVLLKSYTSSYSASRAALLEAAEAFKKKRSFLETDFCQPAYELWLAEAVARGRIQAKGFFSDPMMRKAWCGVKWNSTATVPVLDPTKEVEAAKMRVEEGFSTREAETVALNGSDYRTNVAQLCQENERLIEARKILMSIGEGNNSAEKPTTKSKDELDVDELAEQVKERLGEKT